MMTVSHTTAFVTVSLPSLTAPSKTLFGHPHTHHPRRPSRAFHTMTARSRPATITVGNVASNLHTALTRALSTTSSSAADGAAPCIAISGGSLPKTLRDALPDEVDVSAWRVFLADERIVPPDDADCNRRDIVARFPRMNVTAIDHTLDSEACARDYERKVCDIMGQTPTFDAVLLGLGPDGHTCSLFPEHPLLQVSDRVVAGITDSPKPPLQRVTLTLPVLNAASHIIFVCTGGSKAPVVKDILENADSKLPGALVRPNGGTVTWVLDEAAASQLLPATVPK